VGQTVFKLPDLGEGVVEGEIVAWHVKPGDMVEEDQSLVDVMTDKATVTIPSGVRGRVVRVEGEVGQMKAVGSTLVVLELVESPAENEERETVAVGAQAKRGGSKNVPAVPAATPGPTPRPVLRPLASPAIRRRAREKGVDLADIKGTGHGGRITDRDIDDHLTAKNPQAASLSRIPRDGTTEIHISGLRRRIAQKMTVSNQHIPHFSYFEQVDITELSELRRYLNESRSPDEPKLTYLPFILLSLVKAFRKHPEANAHYDDQREVVTRFEAVHMGIATQTERGLYVPVVRHTEAMDLWEAARELRRVTQAAHHNTIKRQELTGSTFTITSLGVLGGLAATPIINHPEVAILGVHRAYDRPVVRNNQVAIRHMVNLSASFDHRVVDGADGAALIQAVKTMLEHPALIFL
jgi:2-oxoisovalerate dehydrogenase E2 component (dihydrolipoyl transacylase)